MIDKILKRILDRSTTLYRRCKLSLENLREKAVEVAEGGRGPLPDRFADRVWNPALPASPVLD